LNHTNFHIVNKHHEVLKHWQKIKPNNVFCIDYHTDTKDAFLVYLFQQLTNRGVLPTNNQNKFDKQSKQEKEKLYNNYYKNKNIERVIECLENDEFIDFALESEIVKDTVYVYGATIINNHHKIMSNPKIYQYTPKQLFENNQNYDYIIDDKLLDQPINWLKNKKPDFFDDFVLDIDLDVFNTTKSLKPKNTECFSFLFTKAKAITIAIEMDYWQENWIDSKKQTIDDTLNQLLELINSSFKT